jgi:hypothetical protein
MFITIAVQHAFTVGFILGYIAGLYQHHISRRMQSVGVQYEHPITPIPLSPPVRRDLAAFYDAVGVYIRVTKQNRKALSRRFNFIIDQVLSYHNMPRNEYVASSHIIDVFGHLVPERLPGTSTAVPPWSIETRADVIEAAIASMYNEEPVSISVPMAYLLMPFNSLVPSDDLVRLLVEYFSGPGATVVHPELKTF